jgi:membrane-associated phospholipid phosphatase
MIALPAESVSVDLSFHEPRRSKISGITSILSALLIALLAALPHRRKKLIADS